MGTVFLEKITLTQLVEEFPIFHGTWRLLITFTSHKPPKPQESRPQSKFISLISILISSFHLCLSISSGILYWHFPTKIWNVFLISPMHLILLNVITLTLHITKLLIMQVSPDSCYFSLRQKYSPQHPVLMGKLQSKKHASYISNLSVTYNLPMHLHTSWMTAEL
jgi:hypothetical protein